MICSFFCFVHPDSLGLTQVTATSTLPYIASMFTFLEVPLSLCSEALQEVRPFALFRFRSIPYATPAAACPWRDFGRGSAFSAVSV